MYSPRFLGVLLAMAALTAFPALAAAHAHLESTDPEAGANLDEPPTEVTLTFDDELQPNGSGFSVTDEEGNEIGSGSLDLDVAERNVLRGEVSITVPGVYTVSWEIVAEDGHPDSGEFSFGYRADPGEPREDDHEHAAPDTAVPAPQSGSPLTIVGALLVAGGGALAIRRRVASAGIKSRR